jgi:uncharacterized protein (DUF2236 family)
MHGKVRGQLERPAGRFDAGTPFAADDPELLLWVLATLVDSALVFYDRYVASLSPAERDAYWQDYRVIGTLFGLQDHEMPVDIRDFDDYMRDMITGSALFVTSAARELALQIVMRPPVPLSKRPLLEVVNFITVGLLPVELRRQFGLSWDPLRALMLRGGAEYAKRVLVPLAPGRLRFVSSARTG